MARTLTFCLGEKSYACGVEKLDRKKLYGYKRRQVLDDRGRPCRLGLLCEDGKSLLGPGGVAQAYLDGGGDWTDRGALVAVDDDGNPLPLLPSSYDGAIRLGDKVGEDELAQLAVRDVLQLGGAADAEALRAAIGDDVYRFTYSYRADYSAETAYLVATAEGLFALVGQSVDYRFVGLQLEEGVATDEEPDVAEDDDDLDFGMI